MTSATTWAADHMLLVWADWLEDQGDAACEGVRWLVAENKRPQLDDRLWWWWKAEDVVGHWVEVTPVGSIVPDDVFDVLEYSTTRIDYHEGYKGSSGAMIKSKHLELYRLARAYTLAKYAVTPAQEEKATHV